MRVNIWVKIRDVVNNDITEFLTFQPQTTNWEKWVQISITQDEFVNMMDGFEEGEIGAEDDGVKERETELDDLYFKYQNTTGGDFKIFWETLSKKDKDRLKKFWSK